MNEALHNHGQPVDLSTDPIQLRMKRVGDEYPDRSLRFKETWIHVSAQEGRRPPAQGWKLHISATVITAPEVLERVLPILLAAGVELKVAASIPQLKVLNAGRTNRSQIGKFLTAYPPSDAVAVELAQQLHERTIGLTGPLIPSDRPLHPGSLVYYRYGGFQSKEVLLPNSSIVPAITDPSGQLIADTRNPWYTPPTWAVDPFLAAGVTTEHIPTPGPLSTRYKVIKALHQTGKGGVYLAEDLSTSPPRQKVLKEARRHINTDPYGRDSHDRLRHEYALLKHFAPSPLLPEAYDLFEQDGSLFLVMELLTAKSLRSRCTTPGYRGEPLPLAEVCSLGRGLVDLMAFFHDRGFVLRDFTPNNVLWEEGGQLRLIDLELAYDRTSDQPPFFGWTRGYGIGAPPETIPTYADDYYALGGCLFYLATSTDPVVPEDGRPELDRQMQLFQLLRPDLPEPIRAVIRRLRHPDPRERSITLAEVRTALSSSPVVTVQPEAVPDRAVGQQDEYLETARNVGEWLLTKEQPQHPRFQWLPSDLGQTSMPNCIQFGAAGTGLFLAELYAATGDQRFLDAAERTVDWCQRWAKSPFNQNAPGLYFGHAGVPWLMQRLAQITHNVGHLEAASAYLRWVDTIKWRQIDLTHGSAGVGLVHLALAQATDEPYHWQQVREIADQLLTMAQPAGAGVLWPSFLGDTPEWFYGYAHGAAGIAYYLLEAARATGEERYLETAATAARGLLAARVEVRGGAGWSWGHSPTNPRLWPHLCNGASGVGQFLLRLYDVTKVPDYREGAEMAAVAAFHGCQVTSSGVCHGIAGEGEFLLDLYQVLREDQYLRQAHQLAELLAVRSMQVDGHTLWLTDGGLQADPDFMIGSAGVGHFQLRLALPDQLTRAVMLPPTRFGQVPVGPGGRT